MRIGLGLGWLGEPLGELLEVVQAADRLGVDSVWSLEEYGPDAVTVLGYLAARTERIKLGTGIMQMPARTPAMTAMTALSLDVLSGGRFQLGLGLSVPWLVEGWHGVEYGKPLARAREYVEILRAAMAGKTVEHAGEHYEIPFRGTGCTRAKPMRTLITPFRKHIPIYLAAIGPRHVALTGEIADGWLPGLYAPEHEAALIAPLDAALQKAGRDPADIDIVLILQAARRDTVEEARDFLRPLFAAYLGPEGPRTGNPYFQVACQMGYEAAARTVREHYTARRRADAAAAVPDAFIDEVALVGPLDAIVDRIAAWRESRVGTIVPVTQDLELLEAAMGAVG